MYACPPPDQGAKKRPEEFTREERAAYVKAHRRIPPELLTVREGGTRVERSTPWLVEPLISPMVERLSRGRLGYCNATEYTLRLWLYEQSGHVFGERTISRRLRAMHDEGRIQRTRIPPGGRFKNGMRTRNGTTTNRFPSEGERRERLWQQKRERRRQRREAKARKRAERVIARTREQKLHEGGVELLPAPPEKILSALPVVMSAAERAALFAPPSFLAQVVEPRGGSLTDEQHAERRRKVEQQLAAAHAMRELWDDDRPPD